MARAGAVRAEIPRTGAMRYELTLGAQACNCEVPLRDPLGPPGTPQDPDPVPLDDRGNDLERWRIQVRNTGESMRSWAVGLIKEIICRLYHVQWARVVRPPCAALRCAHTAAQRGTGG